MFTSIVDVLSHRYGWSYNLIAEEMYWEDVYEMFKYARNMDVIELSRDMQFNYMLHAQSKEALDAWQNEQIPFPKEGWQEASYGGTRIKDYVRKLPSKMLSQNKASAKQVQRMEEVKKKMQEHTLS